MEPNKFEKHIKKQLQEREITPSADSWSRLSDTLDEDTPPIKKKGYFWYAVAASITGLLILSVFLFNTVNDKSAPKNQIVEKEHSDTINDQGVQKNENQPNAIKVVDLGTTDKEIEEIKSATQEVPTSKKKVVKEELANTTIDVQVPLKDASEELINAKVMQVVAEVYALEQNNEKVTDAEVDSLLRKAQEDILNDKLFRNDNTVDAMALLNEVEDELDKSFRDQIFESLKSGFVKVRTAVADRNN